ncbi:MAG: hypothetical protein DRP11_01705 [Candidatus Aenigmatarchaeota archaeon]|nr:MAG: hypothetical protein DRP11_01705 [Candidatus Aenigmarchaeota archaeon]
MKLEDLSVGSISKVGETFEVDEKVSDFVGRVKEKNLDAAAVFDGSDYKGIVTHQMIAERNIPLNTKLSKVVLRTPLIEENLSVMDVAELMVKSGVNALPVFINGFEGLITDRNIISALTKVGGLREWSAEDVASEPILINMNDDIGKARNLMREKNVSRLPVVDDEGKLVGMVDSMILVKHIPPKEGITRGDAGGDTVPVYDIPASAIMDDNPAIVENNTPLNEVVELMSKHPTASVVVTLDGGPVGIITPKDIIELIASRKKEEGVYVQITDMPELDEFTLEKMYEIIETGVQKVGRVYGSAEYLFVHIKEHQKEGAKTKYSVRVRFMTPVGMFISRGMSWDILEAVGDALDRLERIVIESHKKFLDSRKKGKI